MPCRPLPPVGTSPRPAGVLVVPVQRSSFQGRVILLTGVPAVGKSTVAKEVARRVRRLTVVHFGTLILASIKSLLRKRVQEYQLRSSVSTLVTPKVLEAARQDLVKMLRVKRREEHILIDSHAVSSAAYGFRSTPDAPGYLQRLDLDLVIQLYAQPGTIDQRRRRHPTGRPSLVEEDVLRYELLQAAVSTFYAATSSCPLCYVSKQAVPSKML